MALHKLVKNNYGRKSLVSIKYENLLSFKGVILLFHRSLKQEEYHIYLAQLTLQSL